MSNHLKTALITGSAGFIGLHTVDQFVENGWFVYALVHNTKSAKLNELQNAGSVKILTGDITNFKSMESVLQQCPDSMDVVVHCAGRASDIGWASEFKNANFRSIQHLVTLTKQYNVKRLVFVSTTDVYGMRDFHGGNEEELGYEKKARNNYPKYKILAEKWIIDNLPSNRYSIVRPAAVWGDDDPTLTKRIRDFLAWSPFILHFGKWKGQNRWPVAEVRNVAKANFLIATSEETLGKAINVLEPEHISMDDFYHIIAKKYFPDKVHKTVVLPFWLGVCFGFVVSCISNALKLKQPIVDPSLYALYSVSKNLDFDSKRYQELIRK